MKLINIKHLLSAMLLAAALPMSAQGLKSAYYTEDFKFGHTMNPAFAPTQNYVSVPALGNINISMQGNFGYEDIIHNNPNFGQPGQKRLTTFMNPYISAGEALGGFNSGDNKLQSDIKLTILSAGFKAWGGYNTIELSSRTNIGLSLPYELFAFAKNTGNKRYEIGDIDVQAQSLVELAFGHSRDINEKLRVGAKVKVLIGAARADVEMDNMVADLSGADKWTISGQAKADVSMKGFMYKTASKNYNNPNYNGGSYQTIDDIDIDGAGIGGFGLGLDLGGVYKIDKDWTVNASVLDLGFVSWSENHRAASSGEPFVFNGFRDISVVGGSGNEFEDIADNYGDQLTDFANLQDKGQNSRTTMLAATINVGATYNLPVYRKITFGVLGTTTFNGPYSWSEGRLSANWTPTKWLDGGASFAVNSFGTSCGWVINFHPKAYNFFIGMDHILGDQSKEGIPLSSKASIALGMSVAW